MCMCTCMGVWESAWGMFLDCLWAETVCEPVSWNWSHRKDLIKNFMPIRKALPYTTEKGDVCRIYSPIVVITCAVCVCKCVHVCVCVCVCKCTMYEMHIHLMGHYICWMYSVVMSKGKALCCELRTGSHMETPHVQRVVSSTCEDTEAQSQ